MIDFSAAQAFVLPLGDIRDPMLLVEIESNPHVRADVVTDTGAVRAHVVLMNRSGVVGNGSTL